MKEYRKALSLLSAREVSDLHSWLDSRGLLPFPGSSSTFPGSGARQRTFSSTVSKVNGFKEHGFNVELGNFPNSQS